MCQCLLFRFFFAAVVIIFAVISMLLLLVFFVMDFAILLLGFLCGPPGGGGCLCICIGVVSEENLASRFARFLSIALSFMIVSLCAPSSSRTTEPGFSIRGVLNSVRFQGAGVGGKASAAIFLSFILFAVSFSTTKASFLQDWSNLIYIKCLATSPTMRFFASSTIFIKVFP